MPWTSNSDHEVIAELVDDIVLGAWKDSNFHRRGFRAVCSLAMTLVFARKLFQ